VDLSPGDHVSVRLRADLVDDDYVWQWHTRIAPMGDPRLVKASFQQSTFYSAPLALERLKRREAGFVPQPIEAVEIDRLVLGMIDGRTSLGAIANRLLEYYPQRFERQQDALTHAADLVERYRRRS
jgi:hypothetical protein